MYSIVLITAVRGVFSHSGGLYWFIKHFATTLPGSTTAWLPLELKMTTPRRVWGNVEPFQTSRSALDRDYSGSWSGWVPTCSTSNSDHVQMSLFLPDTEEKTKTSKQAAKAPGILDWVSQKWELNVAMEQSRKCFRVIFQNGSFPSWNSVKQTETRTIGGGLNSSLTHVPSQNIWQHIVDEVLYTLMLSGTLQKKLEGFQIPAVIFNQAL